MSGRQLAYQALSTIRSATPIGTKEADDLDHEDARNQEEKERQASEKKRRKELTDNVNV